MVVGPPGKAAPQEVGGGAWQIVKNAIVVGIVAGCQDLWLFRGQQQHRSCYRHSYSVVMGLAKRIATLRWL